MKTFNQFKTNKAKEFYMDYLDQYDSRLPIISNNYFVETEYGNTYVRECGEGSPLVLLPGTNGSSVMYHKIIKKMSKHFKVYAIDIVGDFGRSILNKQIKSTDDYIKWQKELYTKLGFKDNFSIMGVSMGAWLGALYCTKYNNVSNLIMISPVAVVEEISLKASLFGIISMVLSFTNNFFMKKYFKNYINISDENKTEYEKDIFEPINVVKKCFKPLPPVVPRKFSKEQIEGISCSVYYFVGEDELLYNSKNGIKYFDNYFKNSKSELFLNAGHDLFPIHYELISNKVIQTIK